MVVGGEVNGGEGNIAKEASGGAFVKADKTQVANNPHRGAAGDTIDSFGNLSLDLQADFDDLKRVCENLYELDTRFYAIIHKFGTYNLARSCSSTGKNLMRNPNLSVLV